MLENFLAIRRNVRKLFVLLCGTKDRYRYVKDSHTIAYYMKRVKEIAGINPMISWRSGLHLDYSSTIQLVEMLKCCAEIRRSSWQKFLDLDGGGLI